MRPMTPRDHVMRADRRSIPWKYAQILARVLTTLLFDLSCMLPAFNSEKRTAGKDSGHAQGLLPIE
jgi:hypothetical protein